MPSVEDLKAKAQKAIERRGRWLVDIAKAILNAPEPGFQETKTSRLVSESLANWA